MLKNKVNMADKKDYKIIPARRGDAPAIAEAIMMAVGPEICLEFAGSAERMPLVKETFTCLAARDDSQYSYRNSFVALDDDGEVAAVVISYDGEELAHLRRAFIAVANRVMGYNMKEEDFHDETSPDEVYLDTIAVFEPHRGKGIAHRLIDMVVDKAAAIGKPVGLLVDYDNPNARALYVECGFKSVGERPFASTMMEHMQRGK